MEWSIQNDKSMDPTADRSRKMSRWKEYRISKMELGKKNGWTLDQKDYEPERWNNAMTRIASPNWKQVELERPRSISGYIQVEEGEGGDLKHKFGDILSLWLIIINLYSRIYSVYVLLVSEQQISEC